MLGLPAWGVKHGHGGFLGLEFGEPKLEVLLGISAASIEGRSTFKFDLGGSLETWPYGDDATEMQWIIMTEAEAFAYRGDGKYSCGPSNTPSELVRWLPICPNGS
jgi:hypothetical protein